MTTVYVVTGLELGWDCVCGVFDNYDDALRCVFSDALEDKVDLDRASCEYEKGNTGYIIHDQTLNQLYV